MLLLFILTEFFLTFLLSHKKRLFTKWPLYKRMDFKCYDDIHIWQLTTANNEETCFHSTTCIVMTKKVQIFTPEKWFAVAKKSKNSIFSIKKPELNSPLINPYQQLKTCWDKISSRFSRNSEVFASEFQENLEEMLPRYYICYLFDNVTMNLVRKIPVSIWLIVRTALI